MGFKARISVFGGREISKDIYINTLEIGRKLAEENFLVFCGGGDGVMEAISKGVQEKDGTVIGILKGRELDEGNDYLTFPIATGIDIARNAILAYNCDVAVAISGKYGTMSEIAYGLQLGKPVIGYKTWDINNVIIAESPTDVISKINKEILYV
ncbi:MAG: TIGR00725 family protein [Candidatus Marinimicrobia bacterium]|nr:TIGR00725 family protein [Candidatus Neomarinimicrobiota bacterium]|tara:strand:+ start:824 stop:1285 length:462 start_codon:yes stop_codon:yes gene_type:complete